MSLTILKTFSLDFTRKTPLEYIFVKQGDQNSRILDIIPLNDGLPYAIPAGVTVRFGAKKADGTQVLNDAEIVTEEGVKKIRVTLSEQTLATAGIIVAEVGLYGLSNELLTSQHFYMLCEPFAIDPDAAESSDEYKSFTAALLALDAAIRASENVNISAVQTATGADITVTNRDGVSTTVHLDTLYAITGMKDVEQAVKLGLGPVLFPVGYEFDVPKETALSAGVGTAAAGDKIIITETASNVKFVVRAHNQHAAADTRLTHTMTLEMKFVYGTNSAYKSLIFDAQEALYYAAAGLEAGSYCFTVKNQAWYPDDNNVTFYFTLTQDVPAGGQLVISAQYNQSMQNKQMKSYPSVNSTTAIETVVLSSTEIPGAVDLGATDGLTENMNHLHRIVFGSNNYAQSNLRQWLNSEGKVNTYYTAQTKFDRPNGNLIGSDTAYAGFAHGFGDDFLNAVKAAVVPYRTNDVFEVDSLDGTVQAKSTVYNVKDKFFLLSRPEIYGSWDSSSLKDGEQLEFYVGLTNTERIKYDSFGTARYCWLRSPDPSDGHIVRGVGTDGSLNDSRVAINGYGAAVACIIA